MAWVRREIVHYLLGFDKKEGLDWDVLPRSLSLGELLVIGIGNRRLKRRNIISEGRYARQRVGESESESQS